MTGNNARGRYGFDIDERGFFVLLTRVIRKSEKGRLWCEQPKCGFVARPENAELRASFQNFLIRFSSSMAQTGYIWDEISQFHNAGCTQNTRERIEPFRHWENPETKRERKDGAEEELDMLSLRQGHAIIGERRDFTSAWDLGWDLALNPSPVPFSSLQAACTRCSQSAESSTTPSL